VNKGTEAGGTTYANTQAHDGTYHQITEAPGQTRFV